MQDLGCGAPQEAALSFNLFTKNLRYETIHDMIFLLWRRLRHGNIGNGHIWKGRNG